SQSLFKQKKKRVEKMMEATFNPVSIGYLKNTKYWRNAKAFCSRGGIPSFSFIITFKFMKK
ncbi:MAG: hypothetical protein KDD99_32190, partial [Bacteroidetes bacterium]|nr:hypothetical protein [Bacteroidota bacterium]